MGGPKPPREVTHPRPVSPRPACGGPHPVGAGGHPTVAVTEPGPGPGNPGRDPFDQGSLADAVLSLPVTLPSKTSGTDSITSILPGTLKWAQRRSLPRGHTAGSRSRVGRTERAAVTTQQLAWTGASLWAPSREARATRMSPEDLQARFRLEEPGECLAWGWARTLCNTREQT